MAPSVHILVWEDFENFMYMLILLLHLCNTEIEQTMWHISLSVVESTPFSNFFCSSTSVDHEL
jgi:hypothetical protein